MTNQTIQQLFDLTGKGAIVTGGAVGIGQAIAFRLAEAGAGVMITDIKLEAAEQTASEIVARGGKAHAIQADASSEADAAKAVSAAVNTLGGLDILVNNAGIYPISPVLEITAEKWDRVFDVNLRGVLLYSQTAAREMINAGHGGKIVNMASMEGLHPREDMAHYTTSKAGVIMLTQAMALELAHHGILINAVAPGGIATPGTVAVGAELAAAGKSLDQITGSFMARLPMGRMGEPDDVAKVVLFLASGAADYVTGTVTLIDGGWHLG